MASTTQKPKIFKVKGTSYADLDRMPNMRLVSEMGVSARPKDIAARMKAKQETEAAEAEEYNKKIDNELAEINKMNARTQEYEQKMGLFGGRRVKKRSCKKRSCKKRSCKKRSCKK
jgi:hypothetical protein